MTETFYEVLGVEPDADREAVEAAFRERAKEVHPDVSDHPDAAERFKRVNRAEAVLADPVERRRYDRLGHETYLRFADLASVDDADPASGNGPDPTAETAGGRDWASSTSAGGPAGTAGAAEGTAGGVAGTAGGPAGGAGAGGAWTAGTDGASTAATGEGRGFGGETATGEAADEAAWRRGRADDADEPPWRGGPGPRRSPFVDRQEGVVLSVVMLVLHPVFLYSAVTPRFPLAVNLVVAVLALAATAYVVATPYVGVAVFGILGLLVPVVLVATGEGLASPLGVLGVVGIWVPFGFSLGLARLGP